MTTYKILCDECRSDNVLHEQKRFTPPPPVEISMSDFILAEKKPKSVHSVYNYTYYILLCKECGYKQEYYV